MKLGSIPLRAEGSCKRRAAAVLIVAIAVYANTLWGGFVFDDLQSIVQNRWIKDPGFLPEIFGSHVGGFNPELWLRSRLRVE